VGQAPRARWWPRASRGWSARRRAGSRACTRARARPAGPAPRPSTSSRRVAPARGAGVRESTAGAFGALGVSLPCACLFQHGGQWDGWPLGWVRALSWRVCNDRRSAVRLRGSRCIPAHIGRGKPLGRDVDFHPGNWRHRVRGEVAGAQAGAQSPGGLSAAPRAAGAGRDGGRPGRLVARGA